MTITCGPNETEAGHLAHVLIELDMREINAIACESAVRGDVRGTVAMLDGRMDI